MSSYYKDSKEIEWGRDFGRNLQYMLHKKEIDQGYLAKQLGSTDAMISRYVHGVSIPSVYKAFRIAEIIGCDISELVKTNYEV